MRPGQAESTEAYDRPQGGGAGENETAAKNPQVAGLQTTRAAQADAPKGWGERKD